MALYYMWRFNKLFLPENVTYEPKASMCFTVSLRHMGQNKNWKYLINYFQLIFLGPVY